MANSKLIVIEARDTYRGYSICWYFDDEGTEGGFLGERGDEAYTEASLRAADRESRPHILATLAAGKTEGAVPSPDGFTWESRAKAANALRAIKAAIKNDDAPWPKWAVKAKAEGWTPPKRWKP